MYEVFDHNRVTQQTTFSSFLSEILHVYPIPADRQDLGMTNPRACMLSRQQPGALLAHLLQQVQAKPKPARVLSPHSNDL